jgi:hypothetical protein
LCSWPEVRPGQKEFLWALPQLTHTAALKPVIYRSIKKLSLETAEFALLLPYLDDT